MVEPWTWEPTTVKPRCSAGVYEGTRLIACVMNDDDAAAIAADHRLVPLLVAERNAAKKAAAVLYDAVLAYMEPAGDTPEQVRARAKAALEMADKVLPSGPALQTIHGHG